MVEILLVEDNSGDVLLIRQIVAELAPHIKVVAALDGEQALQMLANPDFTPVLVVLDLNVPLISGYEVLRRNPRKEIPVVVFSGSFNRLDPQRAHDLGAVEYIQKPSDLEGYRTVVAQIVRIIGG
jgi:CheY-like chemotaxis protein